MVDNQLPTLLNSQAALIGRSGEDSFSGFFRQPSCDCFIKEVLTALLEYLGAFQWSIKI